MFENGDERQHSPNEHRWEVAHREGKFVNSHQLVSVLIFGSVVGLMLLFGNDILQALRSILKYSLSSESVTTGQVASRIGFALKVAASSLTTILTAILATSVVFGGLQTRFRLFPGKLRIQPERLVQHFNPFESKSFFRAFVGLLQWAIAISVSTIGIYLLFGDISRGSIAPLDQILTVFAKSLLLIVCGSLAAFLAVSGVDYLFHWFKLRKDLSISEQERRDELRAVEGNSEIRARQQEFRNNIRESRIKTNQQAILEQANSIICGFDIIVVLSVDESGGTLLAKGRGRLASSLKENADQHSIPLTQDDHLALMLFQNFESGERIDGKFAKALAKLANEQS